MDRGCFIAGSCNGFFRLGNGQSVRLVFVDCLVFGDSLTRWMPIPASACHREQRLFRGRRAWWFLLRLDSLIALSCSNPSNNQKIQETAHPESERLLSRRNECASFELRPLDMHVR